MVYEATRQQYDDLFKNIVLPGTGVESVEVTRLSMDLYSYQAETRKALPINRWLDGLGAKNVQGRVILARTDPETDLPIDVGPEH
jgi:hypothetical protein